MTFITTIFKPNMGIMQNYSSQTPPLSHMKLRPNMFTKISTPTLRNGLTLVTTQLFIHLELKTGLNSKVLGMFKDEAGGKQIVEFVGLRVKLYPYKMLDGSEHKKCKGVTKNVTKRSIQFHDYRECLFSRKEQHRKMNVIRSHCHDIYTEEINKISLSSDDDKRVIIADGIHILAYGHTELKNCN